MSAKSPNKNSIQVANVMYEFSIFKKILIIDITNEREKKNDHLEELSGNLKIISSIIGATIITNKNFSFKDLWINVGGGTKSEKTENKDNVGIMIEILITNILLFIISVFFKEIFCLSTYWGEIQNLTISFNK